MPWGDRTGPMGYGPRSGRAAGYCAGYQVPGHANPAPGRGFGMGFGGGRGLGRGWGRWARWGGYPPYLDQPYDPVERFTSPNPKIERAVLEEELELLQDRVARLKQRLEQMSEPEQANP